MTTAALSLPIRTPAPDPAPRSAARSLSDRADIDRVLADRGLSNNRVSDHGLNRRSIDSRNLNGQNQIHGKARATAKARPDTASTEPSTKSTQSNPSTSDDALPFLSLVNLLLQTGEVPLGENVVGEDSGAGTQRGDSSDSASNGMGNAAANGKESNAGAQAASPALIAEALIRSMFRRSVPEDLRATAGGSSTPVPDHAGGKFQKADTNTTQSEPRQDDFGPGLNATPGQLMLPNPAIGIIPDSGAGSSKAPTNERSASNQPQAQARTGQDRAGQDRAGFTSVDTQIAGDALASSERALAELAFAARLTPHDADSTRDSAGTAGGTESGDHAAQQSFGTNGRSSLNLGIGEQASALLSVPSGSGGLGSKTFGNGTSGGATSGNTTSGNTASDPKATQDPTGHAENSFKSVVESATEQSSGLPSGTGAELPSGPAPPTGSSSVPMGNMHAGLPAHAAFREASPSRPDSGAARDLSSIGAPDDGGTSIEPPSRQIREMVVRVSPPDASPVDVQISQRRGEVHVAVRTPDGAAQQTLRQNLPHLVESLDQAGFRSEMFTRHDNAANSHALGVSDTTLNAMLGSSSGSGPNGDQRGDASADTAGDSREGGRENSQQNSQQNRQQDTPQNTQQDQRQSGQRQPANQDGLPSGAIGTGRSRPVPLSWQQSWHGANSVPAIQSTLSANQKAN